MKNKGDLSDFDHGMLAGARHAGLSVSESADLRGFFSSEQQFSGQKIPCWCQRSEEKCLIAVSW